MKRSSDPPPRSNSIIPDQNALKINRCMTGRPLVRRATIGDVKRKSSPIGLPARARSKSGGSVARSLGPCCVCLEGPVLLTAPHGKEVWREGGWAWVTGITGRRLHRRELFTTELVLRLADSPPFKNQSSFIIWNARVMKDPRDGYDPNYLHRHEMQHSQWHSGLHAFRKKYRSDPAGCVHFDIHGKKDRSGPVVDVGIEALRFFAPLLYDKVRSVVENRLGPLICRIPIGKGGGKKFGISFPGPQERDNGFWQRAEGGVLQRPPEAPSTLVCQSVMMGLVGIQLEVPKALRCVLAVSPRLLHELGYSLNEIRSDLCTVHVPISLATYCCREEEPSGLPPATIPTTAVPAVVSQLLCDVAMLHLLDTEKPI